MDYFAELHAANKRIDAILDAIADTRQRGLDGTYNGCVSLARLCTTLEKEFSDRATILDILRKS